MVGRKVLEVNMTRPTKRVAKTFRTMLTNRSAMAANAKPAESGVGSRVGRVKQMNPGLFRAFRGG